MSNLPNIRRLAYSLKWAIVSEKLEAIIDVLETRATLGRAFTDEEMEARVANIDTPKPHVAARITPRGGPGKIALLTLTGIIMPKASMVNGPSTPAGTSCEEFAAALDAAIADESVSAIVIDVDSPGGVVDGVPELAARIFAARGKKPITAVANTDAGSAAYWLASAADELYVAPSGAVGSVGVFVVHQEASAFLEKEGIKTTIVKAGEFKAEGNPYEPLTDEAKAHIQSDINTIYGWFVSAVAKHRGVSASDVKENFGKGRMVLAKEAVALGMADKIGTLETVLKKYGVASAPAAVRANADAIELPVAALAAAIDTPLKASAVADVAAAAGTIPFHGSSPALQGQRLTMPNDPATASQNGAANTDDRAAMLAERTRVREISSLCREHGIEASVADDMIERGLTRAEASEEILKIKRKEAKSQPVITNVTQRADNDPARGFGSHREFLSAVMENAGVRSRENVSDERLRPLSVVDKDDKAAAGEMAFVLPRAFTPRSVLAAAGSDEQGAYSDTYGGFAVGRVMLPGLLEVGFEGDPTAGRTQALPMAAPTVDIMARTDKNHTTSVAGGLTVTRKPEAAAATASRMALEMITLKATSLFGVAYATEEILTDSVISFIALVDSGFRSQFAAQMLNEKIRGVGGSEYLGVLNSPALVTVSKENNQAADTINAQNIINMAARCWNFGNAVWLANHDTRPQLATAAIPIGTGGVLLYQASRQEGFPDMLWGRPVFYTEFASAVGDVGDIMLCDFSQYLDGLYQPLQSAESIHVRFVNHERTLKFWLRNAGAPWWRSALTPNKSSATLSPFVTLQAR